MPKRNTKAAPAQARPPPQPKAAWPAERHSGEGAASALETLQKLEQHRDAGRPPDRRSDDPHS